jgi:hypothetical protein
METPKLGFGKYKGIPVDEVPVDYLVWCCQGMKVCPPYIQLEVHRRSAYNAEAQAAVSLLGRRLGKSLGKFHRKKGKVEARKQGQRDRAKAQLARVQKNVFVGENFERLRAEFISAGGDLSLCPF